MSDKLEGFIKGVYKKWKAGQEHLAKSHPEEEEFVCFLKGQLTAKENERIKAHVVICERCSEVLAMQLRLKDIKEEDVSEDVLGRARRILGEGRAIDILDIVLKLKEKTLQLLNTTGDILVGQEFVPAPLLRSRSIKDFKDEVFIIKDFKEIRVEIKIENRGTLGFNVTVVVKKKDTQDFFKDLRVTLISNEAELESYLLDSGRVAFEHVALGKYSIEISSITEKLATIILDVNK